MRAFCCCLVAAGLAAAMPASAQIYKCTDAASARSFYSQAPCPKGMTSKLMGRTPAPQAEDGAEKKKPTPSNPEIEFRKRQKERVEAERKAGEEAAAAKRRQEDCQRARELAATYSSGLRIASVNANGERYYLDDAQVEQERRRAQGLVDQYCK